MERAVGVDGEGSSGAGEGARTWPSTIIATRVEDLATGMHARAGVVDGHDRCGNERRQPRWSSMERSDDDGGDEDGKQGDNDERRRRQRRRQQGSRCTDVTASASANFRRPATSLTALAERVDELGESQTRVDDVQDAQGRHEVPRR